MAALFSSMKKIIMIFFLPPWLDNNIPTVGGERAHQLSVADMAKSFLLQVRRGDLVYPCYVASHLFALSAQERASWFLYICSKSIKNKYS